MDVGFWHDPRSGWWSMFGQRGRHRGRRFKRGILKFVLLKLLSEMPRHGYDLIRALREKGWGAGAGSIYPLLAALEAAGLIEGREEGERRTYEVTEKGRRLFEEHAGDLGRFFEDEDDDEAEGDPRTELRDAAARLMQSIAQLGPSSSAETIARVRELLDGTRKEIYALLAQE